MRHAHHSLDVNEIKDTTPFPAVLTDKHLRKTGLKHIPYLESEFELSSPLPLVNIELLLILYNMASIAAQNESLYVVFNLRLGLRK